MATAWLHAPRHDPPTLPLVGPGHTVDLEERAPVVRPPVGVYAGLVGTLALLAIALLWVSPASAVPSYSGQTGLPCSACHVGAFGPQLTPFGISFVAEGYSQGGGTAPWKDIPFSLVVTPSFNTVGTALPTAPPGYNTNDFLTLGCCTFYIAGGHSFDGNFGIGAFDLISMTAFVPGVPFSASEGTSDVKFTKPLTLGDHSLVLGFDFTNKATGGDPYNTLYNDMDFPYLAPVISVSPIANPAISDTAGLLNSVYGMSLYAWYDRTFYAQVGLFESWTTDALTFMNVEASSLGSISGGAPYLRLAYQHMWGDNFLEIGGVGMYIPLQQIPGISDPSSQNDFLDWGFDATYQRTIGPDNFSILANILFEQQTLGASFAAGTAANPSNSLTQLRVTASYYWHNTYGATLAYIGTFGSTDPTLYAPAPLTGSANGSPNWQAIIAQFDWTPFGKSTTDPGFPWLNVRVGVQYTHYLQFNGGTTNYDGFGRNAGDNDTLFFFSTWAF